MCYRRLVMGSFATFSLAMGLGLTVQPVLAQRTRSLELDRDVYTPVWQTMPKWRGKLLLRVEKNDTKAPVIDALDRDGYHEDILFDIPDSSLVGVTGTGASSDGSIVVGGYAFSADSRRASLIAWIAPDRQRRTVIRTVPFEATAVTLAADGTIWAVGNTWDNVKRANNTKNVIQRYDTAGKLLSSLKVVELESPARIHGDANERSYLMASRDRVGWFTNSNQYIEFSLDGIELNRFDGPTGIEDSTPPDGVALSDANDLVVGRKVGKGRGTELLVLDRPTREWVPISVPGQKPGAWLAVFGFDGTTLVASPTSGKLLRLRLVEDPSGKK